ncbi:MAG TPA: hypothetical protein EYH04_02150 [Archaeoglobus profundus]|nr:hypothetical protein [Archaeoglobus profundus]
MIMIVDNNSKVTYVNANIRPSVDIATGPKIINDLRNVFGIKENKNKYINSPSFKICFLYKFARIEDPITG